jgi:hypothetical protein
MLSRRSRAEAARRLCSITAILVRNCGLGTTLFAELATGAGVAYKYWRKPWRVAAKNGPMRDFTWIRGWPNRRPVAPDCLCVCCRNVMSIAELRKRSRLAARSWGALIVYISCLASTRTARTPTYPTRTRPRKRARKPAESAYRAASCSRVALASWGLFCRGSRNKPQLANGVVKVSCPSWSCRARTQLAPPLLSSSALCPPGPPPPHTYPAASSRAPHTALSTSSRTCRSPPPP